ncbi:MAG: DUF3168 domain-containing protein [Beijerinckiaceae bacterium]|nr:DUF3168 domain-containing protein [Beijerinckiaceae bacterium]
MEEAFRAYLVADTALAALISTRLTWGLNDQGSALPRVTLQRISGNPEYSDEGEAGLSEARVQADCFATTYAGAIAIARAIKARVSGENFTQDSITFDVFIDSERDFTEMFEGGREVHRVSVDLMVWHNA